MTFLRRNARPHDERDRECRRISSLGPGRREQRREGAVGQSTQEYDRGEEVRFSGALSPGYTGKRAETNVDINHINQVLEPGTRRRVSISSSSSSS